MGDMILALERNGHTYRRDGSIYFRIASFPQCGRRARPRGDAGRRQRGRGRASKDNPRDFVLWKGARPGEPSWDFGTGPGRPGWHIECSAMALRCLASRRSISMRVASTSSFRITRMRSRRARAPAIVSSRASGCTWSTCLSRARRCRNRSATRTLADVVRGHRPSALRYLLLSSHYRKQLNFTWTGMDQAEEAIRRIVDFLARLEAVDGDGGPRRSPKSWKTLARHSDRRSNTT